MSRRMNQIRDKIGDEWTDKKGRTHTSGNRGQLDGLIPTAAKDRKGNICTEPMSPEKEQRIRERFGFD